MLFISENDSSSTAKSYLKEMSGNLKLSDTKLQTLSEYTKKNYPDIHEDLVELSVIYNIPFDDNALVGFTTSEIKESTLEEKFLENNGKDLTNLALYAIAAGAIYDPFVSLAGNDLYMNTLNSFLPTDQSDELSSLIKQAINTKKPLYATTGDGTYTVAKLSDMLSKDFLGYSVIKGTLVPEASDSNTLEYINGSNSIIVSADTSEVINETQAEFTQYLFYSCCNSTIHFHLNYAKPGHLTSMLIHNAYIDSTEDYSNYTLFLNALGDIVLADNTIVLPAISNPLLYEKYYPYTAIYMGHTPIVKGSYDGKLLLQQSTDVNKYIPVTNFSGFLGAKVLSAIQGTSDVETTYLYLPDFQWDSFNANGTNISGFTTQKLEQPYNINDGITNFYLNVSLVNLANNIPLFPVIDDNSSETLANCKAIVTSALNILMAQEDKSVLITSVIEAAKGGTSTTYLLAKNDLDSYTSTFNFFENLYVPIVESFVNTLCNIDGVLSIKNAYDSTFFSFIVNLIRDYYFYIALFLIVLVLVQYFKHSFNFTYFIFLLLVVLGVFSIYTSLLPTFSSGLYNFFTRDINHNVTWASLMDSAERYDETYRQHTLTSGESKPYTVAIDLYMLTEEDALQISNSLTIPIEEIYSGDKIFLDEQAGIFVQGNYIKMSVDSLFANNTIQGLYSSQWENTTSTNTKNPYILKMTEAHPSLDSHYMPFIYIAQSFIGNLNSMTEIFQIQRRQITYDAGFSKDAFVINAFLNSALFYDASNFELLQANIRNSNVDISAIQSEIKFGSDWLGLSNFLMVPNPAIQNTVWGTTLRDNGYYTLEWKPTTEMDDLIAYVNNQTKLFILENFLQICNMSDENAIKSISLYATTMFNQRVSRYFHTLYPTTLNSSEIELDEVLYTSVAPIYTRALVKTRELVPTMEHLYPFWGPLLLLVLALASVLLLSVLHFIIPILYALFGIFLVCRFALGKPLKPLYHGYIKISLSTMICYFIFNLSLSISNRLGESPLCFITVTLVVAILDYFLAHILAAVIFEPFTLGNSTFSARLIQASNRVTFGGIDKLMHFVAGRKGYSDHMLRSSYLYRRDTPIEVLPIAHVNPLNQRQSKYSPYRRKRGGGI